MKFNLSIANAVLIGGLIVSGLFAVFKATENINYLLSRCTEYESRIWMLEHPDSPWTKLHKDDYR